MRGWGTTATRVEIDVWSTGGMPTSGLCVPISHRLHPADRAIEMRQLVGLYPPNHRANIAMSLGIPTGTSRCRTILHFSRCVSAL